MPVLAMARREGNTHIQLLGILSCTCALETIVINSFEVPPIIAMWLKQIQNGFLTLNPHQTFTKMCQNTESKG